MRHVGRTGTHRRSTGLIRRTLLVLLGLVALALVMYLTEHFIRPDEDEDLARVGHPQVGRQASLMMPGSTGSNRSATAGSWPATISRWAPASAWIVSKAASISGRLVMI